MKLLLPSGEGWDEGENIKCSVRCAHDSKATCGSPHRGRVSFFARAKKETKESTPRMARPFPLHLRLRGKVRGAHPCAPVRAATGSAHPCASRRNRRSPQLAGRKIRASGSNTRLASPDSGCDARARRTGGLKNYVFLLLR